jgi:hypothetical protein
MLPTAIPLLFDDDGQRRLFLQGEGAPCLHSLLESIACSPFGPEATVLTEGPEGDALAARCGLRAKRCQAASSQAGPLCRELETARIWLARHAAAADRVLAVNPKALTLTPQLLTAAVNQFEAKKPPVLVSVTEPRDHPIQYVEYFHVVNAKCLHFLETDCRAPVLAQGLPASFACTRPFPDAMEASPGKPASPGRDAMVRRALPDGQSRYFLDPGAVCPALRKRGARLAGVIPPLPGAQEPICAVDIGGELEVRFDEACCASGDIMRLIPLGTSGPTGPARDYLVTGAPPRIRFAPFGEETFGALCLHLREGVDGAYDIATPFLPDDTVWRLDGKSNRLLLGQNGETFCGRQDFPEVLTPDGSFFLAAGQALEALPALMRQGRAHGFVLEPDQSLVATTLVDFLRTMVRTAGKAACP